MEVPVTLIRQVGVVGVSGRFNLAALVQPHLVVLFVRFDATMCGLGLHYRVLLCLSPHSVTVMLSAKLHLLSYRW